MTDELNRLDGVMAAHKTTLVTFCKVLAERYDATNSGDERIKYNFLYPLLFRPLDPVIRLTFYHSLIAVLDEQDADIAVIFAKN